jgi:hypothetical protein
VEAGMTRTIIALLLAGLILSIASCSGGGTLVTEAPYVGKMLLAGTEVGNISFTISNGQVAGSASFVHNGQPVTVALFGTYSNGFLQGEIVATGLGAGLLSGNVSGNGTAFAGSFDYSDLGGISNSSGTWNADARNTGLN